MFNNRPAFLDQAAPKGYVAGIGRGAVGFDRKATTSDINRLPKRLQNEQLINRKNGVDLFQDLEDELEEKAFNAIDKKMSSRASNKNKDVRDSKNESSLYSVSGEFLDLKKKLSTVSENEWLNLPDAVDLTRRNKRVRTEIAASSRIGYAVSSVSKLTQISNEKENILGKSIDNTLKYSVHDKSSNISNTQQETLKLLDSTDFRAESEIDKTRKMLQSYIKSDNKNPSGWIALCRLEESCKKFKTAKKIIQQGCEHILHNEDVWLENIRLYEATDIEKCKLLVKQGLKFNFKSEKLWLKAIELEQEKTHKFKIIQKGLQKTPELEQLWKLAVQLEDDSNEAMKVLEKALEFVSQSIDLWIAYYKLSCSCKNLTYLEKKQILAKILKNGPSVKRIWVLACQLEEDQYRMSVDFDTDVLAHREEKVNLLRQILDKNEFKETSIDEWVKEAEVCDSQLRYSLTTSAVIDLYLDLKGLKSSSKVNLSILGNFQNFNTKNLIFQHFLSMQKNLSLWFQYYEFGKINDQLALIFDYWKRYITNIDNSLGFVNCVLLYCKFNWRHEGIQNSCEIINNIINSTKVTKLSDSDYEKLVLALIKIYLSEFMFIDAGKLYLRLMSNDSNRSLTSRFAYKYIDFMRITDVKPAVILEQIDKFIKTNTVYQKEIKLHFQKLQILLENTELNNNFKLTVQEFKRKFPFSIDMWLFELNSEKSNYMSSKIILDKAIAYFEKIPESQKVKHNIKIERLYIEKAKLEVDHKNARNEAKIIIEQALRKYQKSELLYFYLIKLVADALNQQDLKTLFSRSLQQTDNHALVLLSIGLSFRDNKEKSLQWVNASLQKDNKFGDTWCWLYRLESAEKRIKILDKVIEVDPNKGELWLKHTKQDIKNKYLSPDKKLLLIVDTLPLV